MPYFWTAQPRNAAKATLPPLLLPASKDRAERHHARASARALERARHLRASQHRLAPQEQS